jgi:hypothetical protein
MKHLIILSFLFASLKTAAQQYPNNEFKNWGGSYGAPSGWDANNDSDCKGKVTKADKIKGGAKLTVMHCFNPKQEDRSNGVHISYQGDSFKAKIPKGKKVKVTVDYSFTPIANDRAYIEVGVDLGEEINDVFPAFFYNNNKEGFLPAGKNLKMICYFNFSPNDGLNYTAPQNCNASSLTTTIGIMSAEGADDEHKGTTLIINKIKFEIE